MSRSIHAKHADMWHVQSAWAAEWIFNSFKYCTTPEGQEVFRKWYACMYGYFYGHFTHGLRFGRIINFYGERDGNEKLKRCKESSLPRKVSEMNNEERMFQRAAVRLLIEFIAVLALKKSQSDLSVLTGVQCQPEELKLYHEFCQLTRTVIPPRSNAAPTRRKGETSEAWLSVSTRK